MDKCPDQLKFPFALWTRVAGQQLIKELFSIKMPIRTVGEYLKRWNYTPQKPLRKAYRQNSKAISAW
ncbi:MAG: winged helix-turn-helix domain-containing protein [Desulfobacula sp.]|nr:winged helix-turn-helix domain-containing protein [Desulfobacula sp.]MBT6341139.1 winged helix-turn-helix domain-containing protein [Desulfobacula sp.]